MYRFLCRHCYRSSRYPTSTIIRTLSTNQRIVDMEYKQVGPASHIVAIMKLNNSPVNSLNTALLASFNRTFQEISNSTNIQGIVITSSLPSTFSAGLELSELYKTDEKRLRTFWTLVQDCWFNLYSSKLPIAVAINGHCLAGGTVIAVASDYRIAVAGHYGIGVTAAKIGVIAPPWFQGNIREVIGQRQTELMLSQGKIFSPKEAFDIKLVDEIYDGNDLVTHSAQSLLPFMETSFDARVIMKQSLRKELIQRLEKQKDEDTEKFVNFILKPSVQERLGTFISTLKSK